MLAEIFKIKVWCAHDHATTDSRSQKQCISVWHLTLWYLHFYACFIPCDCITVVYKIIFPHFQQNCRKIILSIGYEYVVIRNKRLKFVTFRHVFKMQLAYKNAYWVFVFCRFWKIFIHKIMIIIQKLSAVGYNEIEKKSQTKIQLENCINTLFLIKVVLKTWAINKRYIATNAILVRKSRW